MMAICGCDTMDFLQENLGALRIGLSEEVVRQIDEMFAPGRVSGDRYHASMMKMLDR